MCVFFIVFSSNHDGVCVIVASIKLLRERVCLKNTIRTAPLKGNLLFRVDDILCVSACLWSAFCLCVVFVVFVFARTRVVCFARFGVFGAFSFFFPFLLSFFFSVCVCLVGHRDRRSYKSHAFDFACVLPPLRYITGVRRIHQRFLKMPKAVVAEEEEEEARRFAWSCGYLVPWSAPSGRLSSAAAPRWRYEYPSVDKHPVGTPTRTKRS